jgi:hypothetical protein
LVYMIFFAEFEWYGKRYVPLDEVCAPVPNA